MTGAAPTATGAKKTAVTRVDKLALDHALGLERLRQCYAAEMGGPTASDPGFSRRLLLSSGVTVWGAWAGDVLIGFAIVFELPEAVYGAICGNLDDLFVLPAWRGHGVARALMAAVAGHGAAAEWSHVRWLVPETDVPAIRLYEQVANRAPWHSYVLRLDPTKSA